MPNRSLSLNPLVLTTGVIRGLERPGFGAFQADHTEMFGREVQGLDRESPGCRDEDLACMSLSRFENPQDRDDRDLEAMSLSRARHGRGD